MLKKHINSTFLLTRLEEANFEKEFFDKIISLCVLEHIPNYLEVLKESYRILKNEGQFLISVDSLELITDEKLLKFHSKKYSVAQYFNINKLKTILQEIGFRKRIIYSICRRSY